MKKRMKKRLSKLIVLSMVLSAVSLSSTMTVQAETYEGKIDDKTAIAINMDPTTIRGQGNQTQSASVIGTGSIAIGNGALADGVRSNVIGAGAMVKSFNESSNAIGDGAVVSAHADGSNAIGDGATVENGAKNANAIGTGATVNANATNSNAIGTNATANCANDVALGAYAKTQTTESVRGAIIGGAEYTFAGDTSVGAVSIGYDNSNGVIGTRQLQGVSAGRLSDTSTDAVNGSQLYATNQAINKEATTRHTEDTKLQVQISTLNNTLAEVAVNLNREIIKTNNHFNQELRKTNNHINRNTNTNTDLSNVETTLNTHETRISNAESKLANHETRISTNTTNIAINTANIEQNTQSINANSARIDSMTTDIATNSSRITSLSGRVNKVGAGAAALSALQPLDYDADNKFSMATGYGNYAGANAMAIGAFYRPDENVMVNMGGTFGNGENMVNLGVSFAIGSGKSPYASMSKKDLIHQMQAVKDENQAMKTKLDGVEADNEAMREKLDRLEAIIAELAAKQ